MRITLIHVRVLEITNLVPPLGILQIAAVLQQRGFEVQVVDEDPFAADITSKVVAFGPALIGVGFYTPAYGRARQLVADLRRAVPGAIFCAGGIHATAEPQATARDLDLAFCVLGEGERTLLEVCQKLRDGGDYRSVPGLYVRNGADGSFTTTRPLIEDLDSLPLPARQAVAFGQYLLPPGVFRGRPMRGTTVIMTVRGCPFNCTYCGSRIMGRGRVRYRSVASVTAEIDMLIRDYGVKGVFILDESFTLKRDRAMAIARYLKGTGIAWAVQTRVDLIDEELVRLFSECGCGEINFGVESGSDRILQLLCKGASVEAAERVFAWCRKAKVRTTANFMMGHPLETIEDIEATYRLARRLDASFTLFHRTTPYPGTELYKQAAAQGWLVEVGEYSEAWMHRSGGIPVLRTAVPHETLERLRASYQNRFFLKNHLRLRNLVWLFYFGGRALMRPRSILQGIRALVQTGKLDRFVEVLAAGIYR